MHILRMLAMPPLRKVHEWFALPQSGRRANLHCSKAELALDRRAQPPHHFLQGFMLHGSLERLCERGPEPVQKVCVAGPCMDCTLLSAHVEERP